MVARTMVGVLVVAGVGCSSPAPPRVAVPAAGDPGATPYRYDAPKPLPSAVRSGVPAPAYNDPPLIDQPPPEQPAFLDAYRKVNRPRIVLFVNRTLAGEQTTTADLRRDVTLDAQGPNGTQTHEILPAGQYDEAAAKVIDYQAVETILTDWIGCRGQVELISPLAVREKIPAEQIDKVEKGDLIARGALSKSLGADILIMVQAQPTRQTYQGLEIRLIAEAINTTGGSSIARAVVDVPPPLVKTTINNYTRFVARKVMDGLTGYWTASR